MHVIGRPGPARWRRTPAGFTLIEVLVTLVVVGIGLLSAAGLQVMSKKFNVDATQRTTATQLAQSMVERLRANPGQLPAYLTADVSGASAGVDCGAAGAKCSATDLVKYDLLSWANSLKGIEERVDADGSYAGGLINPTGCITQGARTGQYLVAIAWRGVTGIDPPDSTVPADDPSRNTCGVGLSRYDDPLASGADERMRRIIVINVFVSDPNAS